MTIRVEIQNMDEVRRAIEAKILTVGVVMDQAVEAAAEVVREAAAAKAPGPEIGMEKVDKTEYDVGPKKAKFYYAYFETGTNAHTVTPRTRLALKWGGENYSMRNVVRGVGARPFLRPAIDENVDRAGAAAGEVIRQAIE